MIAVLQQPSKSTSFVPVEDKWQAKFLAKLPLIQRQLERALRGLSGEAFEEITQECIVNCLLAFVALHRRRRLNVAFPSSLARFAVLQVRAGRTACTPLNSHEPLSRYAQLRTGIVVERLDRCQRASEGWLGPLIADRRISIPDQVALRIDIPVWLSRLSIRVRRIAVDLAIGCTTAEVAKKHRLSEGRISQVRRELHNSWQRFQSV